MTRFWRHIKKLILGAHSEMYNSALPSTPLPVCERNTSSGTPICEAKSDHNVEYNTQVAITHSLRCSRDLIACASCRSLMLSVFSSADVHTPTYCHVSSNYAYCQSKLLVGVSGWLLVPYISVRLEELGLAMERSKERSDKTREMFSTYEEFC